MNILLVDRMRNFRDGRPALVARTSAEASIITNTTKNFDQLWLDYMLDGMDSSGHFLMQLLKDQRAVTFKEVFLHTDSWGGRELLIIALKGLGVKEQNIHTVNPDVFFTHQDEMVRLTA